MKSSQRRAFLPALILTSGFSTVLILRALVPMTSRTLVFMGALVMAVSVVVASIVSARSFDEER